MVIHIERTGFVVLGRIVMNDSRSEISRFVRNKDTGAWLLASLPWGQVFNGESSYRQTNFTSRKDVPSSRVVGIETKLRAFRIQSYFRKSPLVSGPVFWRLSGPLVSYFWRFHLTLLEKSEKCVSKP